MILKIEDINLKTTSPDDAELKNLFHDPEDLENMTETKIYPAGTPTELAFRIEKEGILIGEIRLKNLRWFNRKAELSVILDKKHQNKGYAKKITKTIIDFSFNKLNLHRLEAEVIEFNDISKRLIESLGFKLEGVLREAKYTRGEYWNILRYGLLRSEYKAVVK